MIATLPPVLRRSSDYQGVIHPQAREFDRIEATIEQLRAQFNPATADILLPAWEYILKLPVGGRGATVDQRQGKVLTRIKKLLGASEGREWEAQITDLVGPGWSYQEHDPADPTSPAVNTLRIQLPFPPSGDTYLEALTQIREITPAHLEIEFASLGGFRVDESHLDLEELTQ